MTNRNAFLNWVSAWTEISGYDNVPGYRELLWRQRKKLDYLVIWRGIRSEGFWRALLIVLSIALFTLLICWHWDLAGWRRDLLRVCPPLVALPWLAAARKRHLREMIAAARSPPPVV